MDVVIKSIDGGTHVTRKVLAAGFLFLLIVVLVMPVPAHLCEYTSTAPRGVWLYVGGGEPGNYTKIQDAIDNATEGDTVFVYPGTYTENLVINKSIVLLGQETETTTILGGNESNIVFINESNVELQGFTIQGTSAANTIGIMVLDCIASHIHQNVVNSCYYGILIAESESLLVSNNTILNCTFGIENVITGNLTIMNNRIDGDGKGAGIEVQATMFRNYIRRNSLTHNAIGINLVFTTFSDIRENTFLDNQLQAFFISSFFNKWQQNYWNHSRFFPKIILGQIGGMIIQQRIPLLNVDWHPAQEPYDVPSCCSEPSRIR